VPELPDVVVYLEALEKRVLGATLERIDLRSLFVLRSVDPPIRSIEGKRVVELARLGKRIVLGFEDDLFLVIHLMIAGRLRWREPAQRAKLGVGGKLLLAVLDFSTGTLLFTEAGTKKRASLALVRGEVALRAHDRGGLEVLDADLATFASTLRSESHTLKRALTDPTLFSGIGNAYSDEILHRAKLSPFALTGSLDDEEVERLHRATRETLLEWTERLRRDAGEGFPEKVTAFRDAMAVHGRHGKPCPVCGTLVQRIVYAENESNYCPRCQTGGKLLADRALSRLLHEDWPRSIEELEERRRGTKGEGGQGAKGKRKR
jgi:formamidopyrimidine-DNA glycosylase